jgi:hypothetical protein
MNGLKTIYKLEIFAAIIGIFAIAMVMLPTPSTMTGYVSGLNITIYSQTLELWVDGSQSYTLTTDDGNLHIKSFMIDGEVVGKGRAEILLDNGQGKQYLIYENIKKKPDFGGPSITGRPGITGMAVDTGIEQQSGTWLAIQPKNAMNYEFTPLNEGDEIIEGQFYSACAETCNMDKDIFNSASYELVFRIEKGTAIRIKEIKYILQD